MSWRLAFSSSFYWAIGLLTQYFFESVAPHFNGLCKLLIGENIDSKPIFINGLKFTNRLYF
jgi:hypothetical protein